MTDFLAESDSQSITNPLDVIITFAEPVTIQQADMLEALMALSPQQRTELVTDWYLFWINVHQGMRLVE